MLTVALALCSVHKRCLDGLPCLSQDPCLPLLGQAEVPLEVLGTVEDNQGSGQHSEPARGPGVDHQEEVEVELAGLWVSLGRGLAHLNPKNVFKKKFTYLWRDGYSNSLGIYLPGKLCCG